jgi:hypothetical protein
MKVMNTEDIQEGNKLICKYYDKVSPLPDALQEVREDWIKILHDKLSPIYSNDSFLMEEIENILNKNQVQEVREKEEGDKDVLITIELPMLNNTHKELLNFLEKQGIKYTSAPAPNSIKEEVECMGRAKRIE